MGRRYKRLIPQERRDRNSELMKKRRTHEGFQEDERGKIKEQNEKRRKNVSYREQERERDVLAKQEKRLDPEVPRYVVCPIEPMSDNEVL